MFKVPPLKCCVILYINIIIIINSQSLFYCSVETVNSWSCRHFSLTSVRHFSSDGCCSFFPQSVQTTQGSHLWSGRQVTGHWSETSSPSASWTPDSEPERQWKLTQELRFITFRIKLCKLHRNSTQTRLQRKCFRSLFSSTNVLKKSFFKIGKREILVHLEWKWYFYVSIEMKVGNVKSQRSDWLECEVCTCLTTRGSSCP